MTETKRIIMAKITGAHGIKGLVKLKIYAEDAYSLEEYDLQREDGSLVTLALKNPIKGFWLAEVEGVTERNGAEALRNQLLYVNESDLPELNPEEDGYYHKDLIGLQAIDDQGEAVGKVIAIAEFGAGDMLEIKPVNGKSFYLPFTKAHAGDVDLKAKTIVVMGFEDYQEIA
jgi:16S rRNA processing protein RimM